MTTTSMIWLIGFLFTTGVYAEKEGEVLWWKIAALLFIWPLYLGWAFSE